METRFYRNHYGLNAETVDGKLSFHTMKVYSGEISTSVSRIIEERPGVRICEPTRSRRDHPPVKRFTVPLLREIHAKHTLELLEEVGATAPVSVNVPDNTPVRI